MGKGKPFFFVLRSQHVQIESLMEISLNVIHSLFFVFAAGRSQGNGEEKEERKTNERC